MHCNNILALKPFQPIFNYVTDFKNETMTIDKIKLFKYKEVKISNVVVEVARSKPLHLYPGEL